VSAVTAAVEVLVYWRRGCWYCNDLRGQLELAGIAYRPIDIWQDPAAAARVRSIANGNETVPTVVIGDRAMVNPSARDVVRALDESGGLSRSASGGRLNALLRRRARRDRRPRQS